MLGSQMEGLQDSLAQTAIQCLNVASNEIGGTERGHALRYDARSTSQPDSWLLEKCWQSLADGGFGAEAYAVAALAELRQPLAPIKALYRLAKQSSQFPAVIPLVQSELWHTKDKIFSEHLFAESIHQIDYILHAATSAALIDEHSFSLSCLERLDQVPKAWDRVFVHPHLRQTLAEAVARSSITPLTADLINKAVLRYSEAGAQFLHHVATCITEEGATSNHPVLSRCVFALQRAVLGSLHSRKIAASVFAQAGDIGSMLEQVRTIATIQDAHRETNAMLNHGRSQFSHGQPDNRPLPDERVSVSTSPAGDNLIGTTQVYNDTVRIAEMAATAAAERSRNFPVYRSSLVEADSSVIRQVSRTSADTDVDFLVYTLKSAIESLTIEHLGDEQRRTLINQLAALGLMSDGWTAAGATSALLELGGLEEAVQLVEQINPEDPTRIESVLALVNGLLAQGEVRTAQNQSQRALAWAQRLPEQTPIRTLRRGLASAYIDHNLPEAALKILGADEQSASSRSGFGQLLSGRWLAGQWFAARWFEPEISEEQLHSERVRFAAHLKQLTNQLLVQNSALQIGRNDDTDIPERDLEYEMSLSSEVSDPGSNPGSDPVLNSAPIQISDVELPPELDSLVHNLCRWAPKILDGEALILFYRDSLLMPLLNAGKLRYAWGLLPHIEQALLKLQSNKVATRLLQICEPLSLKIETLRSIAGSAHHSASEYGSAHNQSGQYSSPDDEAHPQIEAMTAFLLEFIANVWHTCSGRGVWPTIYAIEGCLPCIATIFGPEPVVKIAQATIEQGALWDVTQAYSPSAE